MSILLSKWTKVFPQGDDMKFIKLLFLNIFAHHSECPSPHNPWQLQKSHMTCHRNCEFFCIINRPLVHLAYPVFTIMCLSKPGFERVAGVKSWHAILRKVVEITSLFLNMVLPPCDAMQALQLSQRLTSPWYSGSFYHETHQPDNNSAACLTAHVRRNI